MSGRVGVAVATALLGVLATPLLGTAAKKPKTVDCIWTNAGFEGFNVQRIAMLPAASFDNNFTVEKQVEGAIGQAFAPTGYRWISATTTREMLRAGGSDSLLKTVKAKVLSAERVDSLSAPALCARLRCDALLSVRVDQWEKREMEWDQAGKPSTSVQLRAALVDSSGSLLWTASGSHTAEGPYHDPNANPIGLTVDRKPVTGQGGAPDFVEVVATLAKRWAAQFPAVRTTEVKP